MAQKDEMDKERESGYMIGDTIMMFLQNIVLISHAIPMSIYVAIEVLKWFQVRLVMQDPDLFKKGDGKPNFAMSEEEKHEHKIPPV